GLTRARSIWVCCQPMPAADALPSCHSPQPARDSALSMSADLSDLYQQVILDHNKRPRNRGKLPTANRVAHGDNPSCGDQCSVYLRLDGDRIADISFDGSGCAISQASASLMTTQLKGKTGPEAEALYKNFHEIVTTG